MTTFYILRHADKEKGDFFNPRLRHQDQPISQTGKLRAEKLWPFFADKPISAIYVSEYLRTGQTIEYVANRLQLTPVIDQRLNEIDSGLFDGLPVDEIQRIYPDAWKNLRERKQDFQFPEGETGEQARQRIASLLEEKRMAHNDGNVILVCHEGLVRLTMCHIMGLPVYQRGNFYVDFCGIMEITYQPEYAAWKLIRFNQTAC